jgi:hypothetical protein
MCGIWPGENPWLWSQCSPSWIRQSWRSKSTTAWL